MARAVRMLLAALSMAALSAAPGVASAQDSEVAPDTLPLQLSRTLQQTLPPAVRPLLPTFVSGQGIHGQTDGLITIEGQAQLRRHDTAIQADRITFDQTTQEANGQGHVRVNRSGNRFEGPELQMNVQTHQGWFDQPTFELLSHQAKGDASRIDFIDQDRLTAHSARYSTCPRTPGQDWMPAWLVRAGRLDIDNKEENAVASGATLQFQGVPILAAPYLSFPISDKRKSGLLAPSINLDNTSGLELTLPYYLNLAPHFDATLSPTLMSKRGIDLGSEFRYLQPRYSGTARAALMPSDRLRHNRTRWAYAIDHSQQLDTSNPLSLRLVLNRVSDDNYWRDFPRSNTALTSRLLGSQAALSWARGPLSAEFGVYRWQTLQDAQAPITPPYDRLPTLSLRYADRTTTSGETHQGWDWSVRGETTRFWAAPVAAAPDRKNGNRVLAVAQISHQWKTPGTYIKPRLQLHATQYQLERSLPNGARTLSRFVPTLSLDSGLIFERQTQYFGRAFTQTLEPRAFLTATPYRDQTLLPNYDSAANDFNFASIYSENAFGGNDRISDTRALTIGVSSRLLDPRTGSQAVQLGIAQRYLLRNQNVVLPDAAGQPGGDAQTHRLSDILVGASVQWSPSWALETNVQFQPSEARSVRTTLGARYTPGKYRVLSAAYRLQRGSSEQFDLGWQWPLSQLWSNPTPREPAPPSTGQWYSVGRLNYSVPDRKIVDLVAGFEYDAGCWLGRIVLERLQRSSTSANQRILFQLEFTGFSSIGSNPLKTLKDNVPRYQRLQEHLTPTPNRFEQYD